MELTHREIFLKAIVDATISSKGKIGICDEWKRPISLNPTHKYICIVFGNGLSDNINYPLKQSFLTEFKPPSEDTHKLLVYAQEIPKAKKQAYSDNFTKELAHNISTYHMVEVIFIKHTFNIKETFGFKKNIHPSQKCNCNFVIKLNLETTIVDFCKSHLRIDFIHSDQNNSENDYNINEFCSFLESTAVTLIERNRKLSNKSLAINSNDSINLCKNMAHKVGIFVYNIFPDCDKEFFKENLAKLLTLLNWKKYISLTCKDIRLKALSLVGHIGINSDGTLWLDFDGAKIFQILTKKVFLLEEGETFMPTLNKKIRTWLESGKYVPMEVILYQIAFYHQKLTLNDALELDKIPKHFIDAIQRADVMRALNIHVILLSKKYSSLVAPYLECIDSIWQFMYSEKFQAHAGIQLYNQFWIELNRNLAKGYLIPMNSIPSTIIERVAETA